MSQEVLPSQPAELAAGGRPRIARRAARLLFVAAAAVVLALVLLAYRQPELFVNWAGSLLC